MKASDLLTKTEKGTLYRCRRLALDRHGALFKSAKSESEVWLAAKNASVSQSRFERVNIREEM